MKNSNTKDEINLNTLVGKRLVDLRNDHNYSQEKAGSLLNKSRTVYGQMERGTHDIPLSTIQDVMKLYDIDLNYLFSIEKTNVNVFSGNFEKLSNQGTNNTLNINIPVELIDEIKKVFGN
jgi:transcriptional regulator with XRE-family HTH domain